MIVLFIYNELPLFYLSMHLTENRISLKVKTKLYLMAQFKKAQYLTIRKLFELLRILLISLVMTKSHPHYYDQFIYSGNKQENKLKSLKDELDRASFYNGHRTRINKCLLNRDVSSMKVKDTKVIRAFFFNIDYKHKTSKCSDTLFHLLKSKHFKAT